MVRERRVEDDERIPTEVMRYDTDLAEIHRDWLGFLVALSSMASGVVLLVA